MKMKMQHLTAVAIAASVAVFASSGASAQDPQPQALIDFDRGTTIITNPLHWPRLYAPGPQPGVVVVPQVVIPVPILPDITGSCIARAEVVCNERNVYCDGLDSIGPMCKRALSEATIICFEQAVAGVRRLRHSPEGYVPIDNIKAIADACSPEY